MEYAAVWQKKSGLAIRPDSFFESAVKYKQINKIITYFKKKSEDENPNF
jgi:hypothetical protein